MIMLFFIKYCQQNAGFTTNSESVSCANHYFYFCFSVRILLFATGKYTKIPGKQKCKPVFVRWWILLPGSGLYFLFLFFLFSSLSSVTSILTLRPLNFTFRIEPSTFSVKRSPTSKNEKLSLMSMVPIFISRS